MKYGREKYPEDVVCRCIRISGMLGVGIGMIFGGARVVEVVEGMGQALVANEILMLNWDTYWCL